MAGYFYLVFKFPNQPAKQYFRREAEQLVQGRAVIVPEVTTDVRHAHHFNPDSAVSFRDRYREQYSRDGCQVFIEDPRGNQKFEREVQPDSSIEDGRDVVFVLPDGYESTGLGFLVRPAFRPTGPSWCIRAADVPSMQDRATATESIFGDDPVDTVNRMLATWGNLAVPSPAPWASQQDDAQAKRLLQEFEKAGQGSGRRRPGDL